MKIGSYEIQVPFVTTAADSIAAVLKLAEIKNLQTVVDLGSGDGRMVLEFAKSGGIVTGFEIKEELVKRSQKRISEAGLSEKITIYNTSFWDANLSQFDIIYLYGMQSILGRLEQKLDHEVRPGTKIISNIFRFPHWKVKRTEKNVHLYIKQ